MKQLLVYGELIRGERNGRGTSCPFKSILIPLQRAMTRIGVEAITESMGSLLKKQYQINMKLSSLLKETQILYHGPDYSKAKNFLDKAFELYKSRHCAHGRGGAFLKHPMRKIQRFKKISAQIPSESTVVETLKLRNKFGIHALEDQTFLERLKS